MVVMVTVYLFAVTLSKTKKNGVERKKTLIDQLRAAVDEFKSVYVFRFADMKNERVKQLRDDLKGNSRCVVQSDDWCPNSSLGRASDTRHPQKSAYSAPNASCEWYKPQVPPFVI